MRWVRTSIPLSDVVWWGVVLFSTSTTTSTRWFQLLLYMQARHFSFEHCTVLFESWKTKLCRVFFLSFYGTPVRHASVEQNGTVRIQSISYGKTGLTDWKWRFQHLRGRAWPGKRANRTLFSSSPTSYFGRGVQRRWPFLQDIILKFCLLKRTPSSFLKINFGRDLLEKHAPFSDETLMNSRKSLCFFFFFLWEWQHRKKIERCAWKKGLISTTVDSSHQRIAKSTLWEERAQFRFDSCV